jgi:hypothetical protein
MATERELVGQSRQYVLLPVVRIIFRSLLLPFKHIHEVWKVSLVTYGVMLAANLIELFVDTHTEAGNPALQASGVLVHAIVIAPFAVAWSKIAIDGTTAVENLPALPLGRIELWYAVANVAIWFLFLLPVLPLLGLVTTARQGGDEAMMGVAGILALAAVLAVAFALVRMSFLFPALATGRYQGIRAAWTQTRGYLEALGVIEAGVCVPFFIAWLFARRFRTPDEGYVECFALYALGDAVLLLWEAGSVSGPALAYEFLVLRKHPGDVRGDPLSPTP